MAGRQALGNCERGLSPPRELMSLLWQAGRKLTTQPPAAAWRLSLENPSIDNVVMIKDYFAYGTLMCEDIMLVVTGQRFTRVSGFLVDYRRRGIKNEVYPGIIPEAGWTVEGIVYRDLTDAAWTALDTFEGEMYERRVVLVNLAASVSIEAYAYVIKPEFENRLDSNDWDFEKFLESGKKIFEKRYFGFKALKSKA